MHEYEIFSGSVEREPLWLESVQGREAAFERMKERAYDLPGPYFVYSVLDRQVVASIDTAAQNASASR